MYPSNVRHVVICGSFHTSHKERDVGYVWNDVAPRGGDRGAMRYNKCSSEVAVSGDVTRAEFVNCDTVPDLRGTNVRKLVVKRCGAVPQFDSPLSLLHVKGMQFESLKCLEDENVAIDRLVLDGVRYWGVVLKARVRVLELRGAVQVTVMTSYELEAVELVRCYEMRSIPATRSLRLWKCARCSFDEFKGRRLEVDTCRNIHVEVDTARIREESYFETKNIHTLEVDAHIDTVIVRNRTRCSAHMPRYTWPLPRDTAVRDTTVRVTLRNIRGVPYDVAELMRYDTLDVVDCPDIVVALRTYSALAFLAACIKN